MKRNSSFMKMFFAAAVITGITIFYGCKQNTGTDENQDNKPKITITVKAANELKVAAPNHFEVAKGSKWQDIKVEAEKKITASENYKIGEWKEDSNAGKVLTGSFIFEKNQTIFATAILKSVPTPPTPNVPDADSQGLISVPVPQVSIQGINSDCTMPGREIFWYGVFRKGRNIKLSPYKIGTHEVTYKLWKEVADWAKGKGYEFTHTAGQKGGGKDYDETKHSEDEPVTMVNWRDCIVWCNAYTEKTEGKTDECVYTYKGQVLKSSTVSELIDGTETVLADLADCDLTKKGFRLPTDTEWEFAARYRGTDSTNAEKFGDIYLTHIDSGSGASLPVGFFEAPQRGISWEARRDELSRIAVYGKWWTGNKDELQGREFSPPVTGTAKAGSKAPNALGLYDMSGNVWEWCWDWYDDEPSANDDEYIKQGVIIDPKGAKRGKHVTARVGRGGSWFNAMQMLTVGQRNKWAPSYARDNRGFRLARTSSK